jgi:hypothetical protein
MDIADQNETAGATRQDISQKALYSAQRNDSNLSQVIQYLENSAEKPSIRDMVAETKTTRHLMNEWKKLELGEDRILRRRAGPRQFSRMVHRELREEMGNLGWERTF